MDLEDRYGYQRAVRVENRVIVSGTAPVSADGSQPPSDAAAQARRCCEIIVGALEANGSSSADVVRTRMYVTSHEIADEVGLVHREFFGSARPAATMVVVEALLDPGWLVEIEAEALVR